MATKGPFHPNWNFEFFQVFQCLFQSHSLKIIFYVSLGHFAQRVVTSHQSEILHCFHIVYICKFNNIEVRKETHVSACAEKHLLRSHRASYIYKTCVFILPHSKTSLNQPAGSLVNFTF